MNKKTLDQAITLQSKIGTLDVEIDHLRSMIGSLLWDNCNELKISVSLHNQTICDDNKQKQQQNIAAYHNGHQIPHPIEGEPCKLIGFQFLTTTDAVVVLTGMLERRKQERAKAFSEAENLIVHNQIKLTHESNEQP